MRTILCEIRGADRLPRPAHPAWREPAHSPSRPVHLRQNLLHHREVECGMTIGVPGRCEERAEPQDLVTAFGARTLGLRRPRSRAPLEVSTRSHREPDEDVPAAIRPFSASDAKARTRDSSPAAQHWAAGARRRADQRSPERKVKALSRTFGEKHCVGRLIHIDCATTKRFRGNDSLCASTSPGAIDQKVHHRGPDPAEPDVAYSTPESRESLDVGQFISSR